MTKQIDEIIKIAYECSTINADLLYKIDKAVSHRNRHFNPDNFTIKPGITASAVFRRVKFVCSVTHLIREVNTELIISNSLEDLSRQFSNLATSFNKIYKFIHAQSKISVDIDLIDNTKLTNILTSERIDLKTFFESILTAAESIQKILHSIIIYGNAQSFELLAQANSEAKSLQKLISKTNLELNKETETLKANRDTVQKIYESIDTHFRQIKATKNHAKEISEAISKAKDSALEGKSKIQYIQSEAENLSAQISSYYAAISNYKLETEALYKQKNTIDEYISKAHKMLSSATVAGLASTYAQTCKELSLKIYIAKITFYCSIAILFLTALPLAIYMSPNFINWLGLTSINLPDSLSPLFTRDDTANQTIILGNIFARLMLVVPGVWLTKFAARQHALLFKLREHYAYKYSIACSVEGFKKQAESYKEEIAAATFFELNFNPAERMEAGDSYERCPNPLLEWILEKVNLTQNETLQKQSRQQRLSPRSGKKCEPETDCNPSNAKS